MPIPHKKVFLIILDGFGLAGKEAGNAILQAGMPYLESLLKRYPAFSVAAAGLVVGLPWGQPGNSEVGHSAIGTGRIIVQDLAHINGEIRNGDFYKNVALLEAIHHAKKHGSALHLMGCTSPGGIHAHTDHLVALLELASRHRLPKVFVHVITDGQDMPPQDGIHVIETLRPFMEKAGARFASVQGRSFAMDRVLNWALTERVWHAVVLGDAPALPATGAGADALTTYLKAAYAQGMTDYSVEPATFTENGTPIGPVRDDDAVIFFDFRNDRVKQLANPFISGDDFEYFEKIRMPKNVKVVTMTNYADEFAVPIAYPAPRLPNTLGEMVAAQHWKQWRIAEKEKEAHVTNFFNGGRITPLDGEGRVIVSSRMMTGKEYVGHPEMSAQKVVDAVLERATDDARLYVVNFANPDMIGHAGDLVATMKAVSIIDDCLRQLVGALERMPDTGIVITADHGNAEELLDPLTGGADTQHSTRTVPAILIASELMGKGNASRTLENLAGEAPTGTLVDIAPTVLAWLGVEKPAEMTGSHLI